MGMPMAQMPSLHRAVALAIITIQMAAMLQPTYSQTFPIGNIQCYTCNIGTFSSTEGSGTCSPCSAGYYQDDPGSSTCDECPAGALFPALISSVIHNPIFHVPNA